MQYYITKDFLDLLDNTYPITKTNKAYRRMLAHLLFGKTDKDSGLPLLTYTTLAVIEFGFVEGVKKANSKNYNSTSFLEAFQRDVMTIDTFQWVEADRENSKARTALVAWPEEIEMAFEQEVISFNNDNKYDFMTGNKYDTRAVTKHRLELEQEVNSVITRLATPQQKIIIDYLHSLNIKFFTALTTSISIGNTFLAVGKIEDKESLEHQTRLLHKIFTNPKPLYQPSFNGNTERIFPYNESILGLKKSLRKTLCSGWVEFDLASSQLAIISRLWDVQPIREYLEAGNSIWKDLINHLQVTYNDDNKKAIKTALYGICFGMSKKNVGEHIVKYFSDGSDKLFFKHPIIDLLFKARSKRIAFIINQGYIKTAYNKKVMLSGSTKTEKLAKIRSMLAEEAQAIEAKLLEDVIPLAKTTKDFVVTLWQSDGFSVRFTDRTKQERWTKKIQEVVKAKADLYKIPTQLEIEIL